MIRAGLPATTTLSENDFVTTLPAATTTLSPNTTPGKIIEPAPSHALLPMVTGLPFSKPLLRFTGFKGCVAVRI